MRFVVRLTCLSPIILLVVATGGCARFRSPVQPPARSGAMAKAVDRAGDPGTDNPYQMPAFTLREVRGGEFALESIRGQVVLVNFFGVNCAPCRAEAPVLAELQQRYQQHGLVVISVNAWNDEEEAVARYARQFGLPSPVLLDGRAVAVQLGITGVPHTLWLDQSGSIIDSHEGYGDDKRAAFETRTRRALGLEGDAPQPGRLVWE